jgi:hypothetical protein
MKRTRSTSWVLFSMSGQCSCLCGPNRREGRSALLERISPSLRSSSSAMEGDLPARPGQLRRLLVESPNGGARSTAPEALEEPGTDRGSRRPLCGHETSRGSTATAQRPRGRLRCCGAMLVWFGPRCQRGRADGGSSGRSPASRRCRHHRPSASCSGETLHRGSSSAAASFRSRSASSTCSSGRARAPFTPSSAPTSTRTSPHAVEVGVRLVRRDRSTNVTRRPANVDIARLNSLAAPGRGKQHVERPLECDEVKLQLRRALQRPRLAARRNAHLGRHRRGPLPSPYLSRAVRLTASPSAHTRSWKNCHQQDRTNSGRRT